MSINLNNEKQEEILKSLEQIERYIEQIEEENIKLKEMIKGVVR